MTPKAYETDENARELGGMAEAGIEEEHVKNRGARNRSLPRKGGSGEQRIGTKTHRHYDKLLRFSSAIFMTSFNVY